MLLSINTKYKITMYFDRKKLKALLKWYAQEVGKDLIAVLIVDRTGLVVDFLTRIPEKADEKIGWISFEISSYFDSSPKSPGERIHQ